MQREMNQDPVAFGSAVSVPIVAIEIGSGIAGNHPAPVLQARLGMSSNVREGR